MTIYADKDCLPPQFIYLLGQLLFFCLNCEVQYLLPKKRHMFFRASSNPLYCCTTICCADSKFHINMSSIHFSIVSFFVGFIVIIFFSSLYRRLSLSERTSSTRSRTPQLPPGPRKMPILGNSLQIPKAKQWEKFTDWANQYGQIRT